MNQEEFDKLKLQAENGDTDAMYRLGNACLEGDGVTQSFEKAVEWWQKAADLGHADAMFNLGVCYYNGKGVRKNQITSLNWFKKAAEKGLIDALMLLMDDGKGSPFKKAKNWALNRYVQLHFPVYLRFTELCRNELAPCSTFLALMRVVVKVENEHLYQNDHAGLTHYTSQLVLDALLGERKKKGDKHLNARIRLYMATYLNDPTEGRYLFDDVFQQESDLEQVFNRFQEFWQENERIAQLPAQMYSVSLSTNPDKLDLWRAYGKDREGHANGVGLFIPQATLSNYRVLGSQGLKTNRTSNGAAHEAKSTDFLLYRVKYGETPVRKLWVQLAPLIKKTINAIKRIKDISEETRGELNHCVVLSLMRLSYLYKHDAYESEAEVRAIRMGSLDDAELNMDEREPGRLYFNSPNVLFQDNDSAIILGPQMTGEERAVLLWETRKRLLDLGLSDKVNVKSSKVPFR